MISLSKSGSTVTFTFDENSGYLQNGTIDVPVNSLSLITDESDMTTFRKSASNDIFISARYEEFGMSKAELEAWYKENMVGSTGGGVDSGTVQTMIDESISGKADTSAVTVEISAAVSGKADIGDIPDVSNYFDNAAYDSGTTRINFYHNNTIKAYIDASAFIVDGMIDNVSIETISGASYLVIDFNTASGKEDIQIPLTDIFDPSNYYTKQEVDASLSGKQDTLIEGRAIDITNNTVSLDLPISADTGAYSIAEGRWTAASGGYSHAEGFSSGALGDYSHAEGYQTLAIGSYSHTEGYNTEAKNDYEHVSGQWNVSNSATTTFGDSGNTLFSVGNGDPFHKHNTLDIRQNGNIYIADTSGSGEYYQKPMINLQDTLSGKQDTLSAGTNITISGNVISAEGGGKAIEAGRGIAITTGATADTVSFNLPISGGRGASSIIGGNTNNSAEQDYSFAFGDNVKIRESGYACSAVFGKDITNYGNYSFVCGINNTVNGLNYANFITGENNSISYYSGRGSAVVGGYNTASGYYTLCSGFHNTTKNQGQLSIGQYNVSNTGSTDADKSLFTVGNGTANNARHNAFEIRQNGDIYLTKDGQDVKLQDQLGGGEVSSAITSGDTNAVAGGAVYDKFDEVESVTAAALNVLNDKFDGLTLKKLTQAQYDALAPNYDASTLYVIVN